jgi:hypothetical protein
MRPRGTDADLEPADASGMNSDLDLGVSDDTLEDISSVSDVASDPDISHLTKSSSGLFCYWCDNDFKAIVISDGENNK